MILQDRRVMVSVIAHEVSISVDTASTIIHSVLMIANVSSGWVPRMLANEQKACRQRFSEENLDMLIANSGNFFSRIIIGDETSVHHHDSETKQESMQCKHTGSPTTKKLRLQQSTRNIMATVFGTQKVFCFWNSCHIRQPLLETPILPQ